MKSEFNSYLIMEEHDSDSLNYQYQDNSNFTISVGKSNSKKTPNPHRRNQNQQLQDLLETDTVNYGNMSHLSTQKKRLFPDMSFLSKDCTQDHSRLEGYHEMTNKIHFQRLRTRELNQELDKIKQQLIKKYLSQLMDQLNELSDENKKLRQVYKKQAGGGYRQKVQQRGNSSKHEEQQNNFVHQMMFHPETPKPRNSLKTGRKSVNGGSVTGSEQPYFSNKNSSMRQNGTKDKSFFGLGNQNFSQTPRVETLMSKPNKMQYCESSIDIHAGISLVPSPRIHKRRESQLTERKDYPGKENVGNDFFMSLDDGPEASIDNEIMGRMSQPGKMPKQRCVKEVDQKFNMKDSGHWVQKCDRSNFGDTVQRRSQKVYTIENDQSVAFPPTAKNIFLEFLETLLIEERATYAELADDINEVTIEAEQNFVVPSYNANMKPIEKLQKQIMTKNFKLRQLQEVINVFKAEIEQIMGTDIKLIDQLMHELLQVKGKFLQMQQKVNGITGLKKQVQAKEKLKEDILAEIKQKIEKCKIQSQQKHQNEKENSEETELFPIPESIKTLFDFLNINMPKNSKPIDYLREVKELPSNKELFQGFDEKKRASCNTKIKETIDQIREGRKKFNEVIKIYEGRIIKLQQKIQKYKVQKGGQNSQKKGGI